MSRQGSLNAQGQPAVLYFHPWEFDPGQPRLPLGRISRFRTYVGMNKSIPRLERLLARYRFSRGVDVANEIRESIIELKKFRVIQDEPTV